MSTTITIFKTLSDTDAPFYRSIEFILSRIKEGTNKDLIERIRQSESKEERNNLKKKLPAICFSGTFSRRSARSIKAHSGFICLDFDGYESVSEMQSYKNKLKKIQFVYSVFVSPSGKGLKVIVRIPKEIENHLAYFNALEKFFESKHFDTTTKDISRVCYESYDPLIYINENSIEWDIKEAPEHTTQTYDNYRPTIRITDENKVAEILVKWWVKRYPMVEGKRNHNCYVLASAFNDFGINRSLAQHILLQYSTSNFNDKEILRTIESAYSDTSKFGTRYYEDEEKLNNIKTQVHTGVPKERIRESLSQENISDEVIDEVLTKIESEDDELKFWRKTDRGNVKVIHVLFKKFLEDRGFYKFSLPNSKAYSFVRVRHNLIDHASEKEIKDFVLDYLFQLEDFEIYNYFADNTRFFRDEFLSMLATIKVNFVKDTKTASYLYYRNCVLRITKDSIDTIDYVDLDGYVWKDQIIDRDFVESNSDGGDYETFIHNVSGGDKRRIISMESTIGFLLHGHKDYSFCPAVILSDEIISDDPQGGTGKGIFMNAVGQIKNSVSIDGKAFSFESSFPFQLINADTQIIVFDDVKKYFQFERLFSVITEGVTIEKKNKDAIKIPFDRSPKIAITTNYAIIGNGNSHERRKWEIEFHQYYNKRYTPYEEFGRLMFSGWDTDEWVKFDNYMIRCLMLYLNSGLIQSEMVNGKIKKLIVSTSADFVEWCGLIKNSKPNTLLGVNKKMHCYPLYTDFITEHDDYSSKGKLRISRNKFYKWLVSYSKFISGAEPEEDKDDMGKWIRIKHRDEFVVQSKLKI